MFTKTNGKAGSPGAANEAGRRASGKPAIPSIVSEGVHVSGNLVSDGDLQIDGTVDGDITGRNVTVGATGLITGRIIADDLTVDGTIVGEVRSKKVSMSPTASIEGDITHDVLVVAAGARFEGRCRRTESALPVADAEDEAPIASGAKKLDATTPIASPSTLETETAVETPPVAAAEAVETDDKTETREVFQQLSSALAGRRATGARGQPTADTDKAASGAGADKTIT